MNHVAWALVALLAYSFLAPLISLATAEIPWPVTALVANGVLVVAAVGVVLYLDVPVLPYLVHERAVYVYAAGVALSVGILAYYRALASGPVSVVVPIFGLFIATSSAIGIVFLDESLTARRGLGIAFALLAIYLTTAE